MNTKYVMKITIGMNTINTHLAVLVLINMIRVYTSYIIASFPMVLLGIIPQIMWHSWMRLTHRYRREDNQRDLIPEEVAVGFHFILVLNKIIVLRFQVAGKRLDSQYAQSIVYEQFQLAFFLTKKLNILVHKDAIPAKITKKLDIKK